MAFTYGDAFRYEPGALFLGYSDTWHPVGIRPERHALTIAGSRTGKGAALIIPNLLRWPHSVLLIDPKGENAALTWEAREAMGQAVHVLDPFHEADVPARLRATFNPLASINPADRTAREDIRVIADGLVLRHKAEDGEWYDGAVSILAGVITHVLTATPPERHTLAAVRDMLNFQPEAFDQVVADMADNPACGGLAKAAASLLSGGSKSSREFLSGARRSIDSFGAEALLETMAESSFSLSELKASRCTVVLVLPSRYLEDHARFFRLFVRLALNEMEKPVANKTGPDRLKGTPCLFLLDEFFSLGRLDTLHKAAGRMAGNGVHLWPFVQDLEQLTGLYGAAGAKTFFANSDLHIFFGNEQDKPTLDLISSRLGIVAHHEVGPPPIMSAVSPDIWGRETAAANENARLRYQHDMARAGRPRVPPDRIAALTGKGAGEDVARSMIVFGPAGTVLNLRLAPYFRPPPEPIVPPPPKPRYWIGGSFAACFGIAVPVAVLAWALQMYWGETWRRWIIWGLSPSEHWWMVGTAAATGIITIIIIFNGLFYQPYATILYRIARFAEKCTEWFFALVWLLLITGILWAWFDGASFLMSDALIFVPVLVVLPWGWRAMRRRRLASKA